MAACAGHVGSPFLRLHLYSTGLCEAIAMASLVCGHPQDPVGANMRRIRDPHVPQGWRWVTGLNDSH